MSKDILINNKEESRVLKAVKTKEKSVIAQIKMLLYSCRGYWAELAYKLFMAEAFLVRSCNCSSSLSIFYFSQPHRTKNSIGEPSPVKMGVVSNLLWLFLLLLWITYIYSRLISLQMRAEQSPFLSQPLNSLLRYAKTILPRGSNTFAC